MRVFRSIPVTDSSVPGYKAAYIRSVLRTGRGASPEFIKAFSEATGLHPSIIELGLATVRLNEMVRRRDLRQGLSQSSKLSGWRKWLRTIALKNYRADTTEENPWLD